MASTSDPSSGPTSGITSTDWAAARGDVWRRQLGGMEATLAPVDAPLIDALRLDAPYRIADVGCGGGGTTLEVHRRAPATSVVHGFDIAPALIDAARERVAPGAPGPVFELADVSKAAPPGGPYDRLVSRFGTMFFDVPEDAFANLRRWLVPRGRFAFAVWAPPRDNPWMTTVRDVVASVVDVPTPDPSAPGPFRYGDVAKLVALLERAGFADLGSETWRGELPIGGTLPADQAADFALSAFSIFGELLAKAGESARAEAHRELTERFGVHQRGGAVRLGAAVHLVVGTSR